MEKEKASVLIQNDDCLAYMRTMRCDSVDAIVTDPPYGLGLVQKDFDTFRADGVSDNLAFQNAMLEVFKEAWRVAKPGAHLLAFGGTRTYHRLVCAIEDAGWEIRDGLMYAYGCLSEDSEILAYDGWKKIGQIKKGDLVFAYDKDTRTYRIEEVQDTFLYDYNDTAYRIFGDNTDQIISRNHRVLVECGGMEVFMYAEEAAQEQTTCIPILEGVQNLFNYLSDGKSYTSEQKRVLLHKMQADRNSDTREEQCEMYCLWKRISLVAKSICRKCWQNLFKTLRWGIASKETSRMAQEPSNENVGGTEGGKKKGMDGRKESFMEGRGNISKEKRELCDSKICQMSDGISCYGEKRRVCNGTSTSCSESDRQMVIETRGGSSYQSRPVGQQIRESNVIQNKQGTQTLRGAWRTKTTVARIKKITYRGKMWCVKVPSSAIIARRNNKCFVTGNSGFPKSVNVSKYIDAHLGAERKVVGYASNGVGAPSAMMNHGHADRTGHANGDGKTYAITEPATEEAKEWDGFGTKLKPAIEPIVLARKPIEGGIAENVMQYGTGVLNIDACRVAIPNDDSQKGRFPSNFIHDGSSEVVELIPNSAASFFYCAKPSARERGIFNNHPCVKPIALMEYLVKLVTKEGQTVLDPFMGSGTTGIAAYNLDRNFIGIEKDKSYFDIAAKRLDEAKHAPRQMAFF